jgi:C4-dicarboxylate transporter DctQ subunit
MNPQTRSKFIVLGLLAGALFTAIVATLGAHFVWENGAHYSIFQWLGKSVDGIPEGPTTPDLEWPTWMVYSAIPLGTSLMCFRFLQVTWSFLRTGELPHHDHGHVDGLEETPEESAAQSINPYAMQDNLHPAK